MENASASSARRRISMSGPGVPAQPSDSDGPSRKSVNDNNDDTHDAVDHREADLRFLRTKSKEVSFSHLEGTKYIAMATIGSGAYGVVCAALDKKTKEKVAIKKIPNAMEMSVIAKRTFREIKILRHFKHENIVGIKDILLSGEEKTSSSTTTTNSLKDIYVVLDFMESDLHHIIHSKQALSEEHFRFFIYQIFRALKFIHSAHVIHRDLKPSNILVNENCQLKIGDFGMARGLVPLTHSASDASNFLTMYVSTRWYRAPELMLSIADYACGVDVWSVGCIFAEMIRRRQLFPGSSYIQQMKMIVSLLGSPSKELLKRCNSDQIQHFLRGLGQHASVPLQRVFPEASEDALDLLARILVLDPGERISVEEALEHPFLTNYHDPTTEPFSPKPFDFGFETTHLTKESLKAALQTEIDIFKSEKSKRLTRKLTRGEIPLKPAMTYDQLIAHGPPTGGAAAGSDLDASKTNVGNGPQTVADLPIGREKVSIGEGRGVERVGGGGDGCDSDVVNNSVGGSGLNLSVTNLEVPEDVQMASAKSLNGAASAAALMDVTVSAIERQRLSPQLVDGGSAGDEGSVHLSGRTSAPSSVLHDRAQMETSTEPRKPEAKNQNAATKQIGGTNLLNVPNNNNNNNNHNPTTSKSVSNDTKALLKAKLLSGSLGNRVRLNSGNNNNNNNVNGNSEEGVANPVKMTASLKFKEREEKRRRKKEKALERKKKLMEKDGRSGKGGDSLRENRHQRLTDEDLSMLRRWSQMIPAKTESAKDASETSSEASSFSVAPNSVSSSDYNVQSVASDSSGVVGVGTGEGSNFSHYRDHLDNSNSPPDSYASTAVDSTSVSPSQGGAGFVVGAENAKNVTSFSSIGETGHLRSYRDAAGKDDDSLPSCRGDPLISSAISARRCPSILTMDEKDGDVADSVESLSRLLSRSAKLEDGDEAERQAPTFPTLTTPEINGAVGGGAYGVDVGIDFNHFAAGGNLNSLEGFLSSGEMVSSSSDILSTPKLIDGWLDLQQELEERRQSEKNVCGDVSLLEHELNQMTKAGK